jgi:hypothetical protein
MKPLHPIVASIASLVLFLQACTTLATGTAAPIVPALPDATTIPLNQQVTLTSISFREEGQSPAYTITSQTPKLSGSEDERVQDFNKQAARLIQSEIEYFRKNVLTEMPDNSGTTKSSFNTQYVLVFQGGAVWSLKFDFAGYAAGAAHPYHYSTTLNYDLEQGRKLSMSELFPKDSDYLGVISRHCIAELSKRDIGFYGGFQQGAEPTPDNYRNWNITADGLMITFDEYQVAPYAVGPQSVTIPYRALTSLINPKSPLAMFPH